METDEHVNEDGILCSMRNKKQALLNKFLSKTFHMIDQCDPSIASWSSGGDSFVIKDVEEFAKKVLPRYFKHSKLPSFIRQLNFYSFRKLRSEPDVRLTTKSVRFAHEHFRRGRPELLHRIQRITKSQDVCSLEIRSLKDEIADVSDQLAALSDRLDHRLQSMTSAVESDYQQRMTNITLSYQVLSNLAMNLTSTNPPSSPPSFAKTETDSPDSPRSSMSPLMALSMVAESISQT